VQALHAAHPNQTKFMAVRFGMSLAPPAASFLCSTANCRGRPGESDSPGDDQYFMTIPEASMLVLQSAMQGTGGEIFCSGYGQSGQDCGFGATDDRTERA